MKQNFQWVKGGQGSLLRFVRAKKDESSVLWEQRLLALWVEELHDLLLLLLPARARVVPCIWAVASLSAARTARQSLSGENERREDDRLGREGKSLQHRLKAFYFCFLLSFYLIFLMWLAGFPLFCGRGAECWWQCGICFRGSTCKAASIWPLGGKTGGYCGFMAERYWCFTSWHLFG